MRIVLFFPPARMPLASVASFFLFPLNANTRFKPWSFQWWGWCPTAAPTVGWQTHGSISAITHNLLLVHKCLHWTLCMSNFYWLNIILCWLGDLKRICETDLGLISQCCLTKHVFRISKQYLANVCLKINVKVRPWWICSLSLSLYLSLREQYIYHLLRFS